MEAFLRRVLPEGGSYVVAAIAGASGAKEVRGLTSIAAAARVVQRLSTAPVNVYIAVGTYGADRKVPIAKRCVFVDLDGKNFPTKQSAVQALAAWSRAAAFPFPSIVVDSGRGIHAYWTFDRDLPVEEWKRLAEALKKSCLDAGFAIDPTVTADAARILRVPGTLNHKTSPPVPCRVLKDTGTDYDPETLLQALLPKAPSSGALAKLAAMVGADDLGAAGQASYPSVPHYATEIAEKCGVMKEAVETGGRDHTEPQWRHLMALLAFCDDGDRLVHEISQGHPQYNRDQTDAKWALVQKARADGKLKPILCTTFSTYKGSICAQCPYNGRINAPLVLGKLESTSFLPHGYRMGDYSVDKLVKRASGPDDQDLWLPVFHYRISDVELIEMGSGMIVRALYSSKKRTFKVDIQHVLLSISTHDGVSQAFAEARMHVSAKDITEFKHIMVSWLRKMDDVKAATAVELTGQGWGKRAGQDAFVAGSNVYTAKGERHDFYYPDTAMLSAFIPQGDINPWQTAAEHYAKDHRQAAVVTLLTSFAAPLLVFAGVKGLTFSLYSAGSGTGKTSLLKTAQAVWGHPVKGMMQLDDTPASVINKLGFLHSVPAYWDEMRGNGSDFSAFVKTIFTLGQGREKARLTSSIKQQATGTWDTIMTIASNERVADHIDAFVKNTDAGRVRLFEIVLPKYIEDPALLKALNKLDTNYGHAGQIYGKFLAEHKTQAQQLVQTYIDAIRKNAQGSERFWVAFMAVILAAADLVQQCGLLQIDKAALQKYLLQQFVVQRGGVAEEYQAPEDAAVTSIFEFIAAHRPHVLLVDTLSVPIPNIMNVNREIPRDDIYVLKSINDKKLRIKRAAWRHWVQFTLKQSPTTLEAELKAKGVRKARLTLNAGIETASGARAECFEIDLDSPAFASLLGDQ